MPPTDHELPQVEIGADDFKINEPETVIIDQVRLSNSNLAQIDEEPIFDDVNEEKKEGLHEIENVYEDKPQLETFPEIISTQHETAAVQVDDFKILNDNNNPLVVELNDDKEKENIAEIISIKESNINESPCKNDNDLVGEGDDNKEKENITEIISIQESNVYESPCKNGNALVVEGTTEIAPFQESCENNTTLTVKYDSKENEDDEESDDDIQGDDASNGYNEKPFLLDNKQDMGIEIYVGKLDPDIVEDDLVKVFQQFGELKSTRIVRKLKTNKSRGFAFVRFATVDQAKRALSELKDGVEVRGKRVIVSPSQNNHTLFLGNLRKKWKKEQVVQQLKQLGIEHLETICIPEDPTCGRKIRGFAFLEFTTHSAAATAFQRLQKPDAVFGRDVSAKVAFAQSDEDLSLENQVYVEGLTKDWTEDMVTEICKKYGVIVKIKLCPSTETKQKDFGLITFTSSESALACVEGINDTTIGGEAKIKASIAKPQQRNPDKKPVFRGGFKVKPSPSTLNKHAKRNRASAYEDRGYGKNTFKRQKGNMYRRERWHGDSRYAYPYAPNAYYMAPDHSLATRPYTEMEPYHGYIEPSPANQSQSYSGYAYAPQPVVQNPHSQQHQTMYLAPASASQSQSYGQSQLYSSYTDPSGLTQSHWGYDATAVAPQVQPYTDSHQPAAEQIAYDPYDPGLASVVQNDDSGAGVATYAGGQPLPASQVQDQTSYYQGGGSYNGTYTNQQTYY